MEKTVVELFAGVGGFRCGLEKLKSGWKTVWFSQWEPDKKKQWAYDCYVKHFGKCADLEGNTERTGEDISLMPKELIPDHSLLVGGFPCQDYSVAQTLNSSKGIEGKKGILWWQIRDVIAKKKPAFCIFENVDRLIKSPAKQRGRDFGIMLACLSELGYSVEWRIVNAALYGAAQKRKRVFIFAYKNDTNYKKTMINKTSEEIIKKEGFMAKSFPIVAINKINEIKLSNDIIKVSNDFSFNFETAGYMTEGNIYTTKVKEKEIPAIPLKDILEKEVDKKYYILPEKIERWKYLKGAKKIDRISKKGYKYVFSEGAIAFPDSLDKPSRTILTSESTLNRSTHVITDLKSKKLRILTPIEVERLQGFDDNWTNTGMSERMRYFCMGNALVVPMISKMGATLDKIIDNE